MKRILLLFSGKRPPTISFHKDSAPCPFPTNLQIDGGISEWSSSTTTSAPVKGREATNKKCKATGPECPRFSGPAPVQILSAPSKPYSHADQEVPARDSGLDFGLVGLETFKREPNAFCRRKGIQNDETVRGRPQPARNPWGNPV